MGQKLESMVQDGSEDSDDPDPTAYLHWLLTCSQAMQMQKGRGEILHQIEQTLNYGADINKGNNKGTTPVMMAVESGDTLVLQFLLSKHPEVNMIDQGKQNTALMYAVKKGDLEAVRLLVEAGAKVNHENAEGITALIEACDQGHLEIFSYLLEAGAEVNHRTKFLTPLIACVYGNDKLEQRAVMLRKLLSVGADVNQQNSAGYTALMFAVASTTSAEIVACLLHAGANVGLKTEEGDTALTLATGALRTSMPDTAEQERVVSLLIHAGADVNVITKRGNTALLNAVRSQSRANLVPVLLQAGAEVNHELHVAIMAENNITTVRELISHGAMPSVKAPIRQWRYEPRVSLPYGSTYEARLFKSPLLPDDSDLQGFSPLFLAIFCGKADIAHYFLSISFLHSFDLTTLLYSEDVKELVRTSPHEGAIQLFEDIVSQPRPLFSLSAVRVSSAVGFGQDRRERLQRTGLPRPLQNELMFEGTV